MGGPQLLRGLYVQFTERNTFAAMDDFRDCLRGVSSFFGRIFVFELPEKTENVT